MLEDVSVGSMIIEYTGEVISSDECDVRRKKMKHNEDFYYASLCGGYMVDAKFMGSSARFANHSCKPNCQMRKWVSLGEPRLVLVALCDITAGSDITYHYHCYNDGLDHTTKRQVCRCGASNCSGTIGGKVSMSEDEKWEQKAALLLSMEKSCNISMYRSHVENAPNSAVSMTESLRDIITEVDTWIRDCYSPLFAFKSKANCIDFQLWTVEEVEELLKSFPCKNVRCDEYQTLYQMTKSCIRLRKRVQSTVPYVAPEFSATGAADTNPNPESGGTHAPSQDGASTSTKYDSVEWGTLLALLKDVSAVLPIKCVDDGYIIYALEMLEKVSQWAREIYLRTKNPSLLSEWSDWKLSHWAAISKLSKFYKTEVTPYAFMLESTMDTQLSTYIKRAQLLLESKSNYVNGTVSSVSGGFVHQPVFPDTPYHDFCFGIDPDLPVAFEKIADDKHIEPGSDDYTLHCFCRLPETEGESLTLVQCEECSSWYHPTCINRAELDDEKPRAKGKARESTFVCPLCNHLSNSLSSLADPVSQDWFDRFLFRKVKCSNTKLGEDTYTPGLVLPSVVQQSLSVVDQFLATATKERGVLSDKRMKDKKTKPSALLKRPKLSVEEPWSESDIKSFSERSQLLPIKKVILFELCNDPNNAVLSFRRRIWDYF